MAGYNHVGLPHDAHVPFVAVRILRREDIDSRTTDAAFGERFPDGLRVHQTATRGVDHEGGGFHARKSIRIKNPVRLIIQRAMESQGIRFGK